MKAKLVCLFIFLTLSGAISASISTSTTPSTASLEHKAREIALKFLKDASLMTKSVSHNDQVTCQGAWAREGGFCVKDKVLALIQNDKNFLDGSVASFETNLKLLGNLANYFVKTTVDKVTLTSEHKAALAKFTDTSKIAERVANLKKCNDALSKLKNSAMCTICSAQNYKYFDLETKGLFPQEKCHEFLLECQQHHADYIALYDAQVVIVSIEKAIDPLGEIFKNSAIQELFTKFMNVMMTLAKYFSHRIHTMATTTDPAVKEKVSKEYCERVIKLDYSGRSLLPLSYKIIAINLIALNIKVEAIKAAAALKTTLKKLNPFSNWRRLQLSDLESSLMGLPTWDTPNDIRVVNDGDNLQTFDGQAGTSLDNQNNFSHQPMNMSLSFA